MVFYDVTTFSFASVEADSLRDFGFSKDGKFNEVQVVLGLLIDCEGLPIGYELFPGNTFDGKTLEAALEKLEKRFGLRRVIIVADRGINSKLNLKRIVERGYSYIFAARIKSIKKEITDVILPCLSTRTYSGIQAPASGGKRLAGRDPGSVKL